jgi:hypothetical protein
MTVTRRKLKKGETLLGGGSGILIPFMPASSDSYNVSFSETPTMTEEQIQAELKRMKEAGYGTAEIAFAEEAMRGLEGKPKGHA